MNLKLNKRIKVGNLNDYNQILNKVNVLENINLTVDDLKVLDEKFPGDYLTYNIGTEDENAIYSIKINKFQFINFYNYER